MNTKNYFTRSELECPCCHVCIMDDNFLTLLNAARGLYQYSIIINSGYRCDKHNLELGSTSTNHPRGQAVDITMSAPLFRYQLIKCCMIVGLFGIGIHKTYIHVDSNHEKPTLWFN